MLGNSRGDRRFRLNLFIGLVLVFSTAAVYWQVYDHDFIKLDDQQYVSENRYVNIGLTKAGLMWAFTTFHSANWHPVTWLSHMLDCQLFGLNSGMHHLTNVVFHLLNTLVLFVVLEKMTGALWRSAFVSALFALHPLHVESVAWIAERKDVLSTFFWMMTTWAYVKYCEESRLCWYLIAILFLALGLMAKPMLVTLPFVLLLLDYWPLSRWGGAQTPGRGIVKSKAKSIWELLLEKTPFFVIVAISCVITYWAQGSSGAVYSTKAIPWDIRGFNAIVAYVAYLKKMMWPSDLAIFYPLRPAVVIWQVVGAGSLFMILWLLILKKWKRFPYLVVGWLWYVGTLVPVIGLVKVGTQSMADRYTYIPLIGIFIMIAWGIYDVWKRFHLDNRILGFSATLVFLALIGVSWQQVGHWKNNFALFTHALAVTQDNTLAHLNVGSYYMEKQSYANAIEHFNEALRINPYKGEVYNRLGLAKEALGLIEESKQCYLRALKLDPELAAAHNNLGNLLDTEGNSEQALVHLQKALKIEPDYAKAHSNMGVVLARLGRLQEASIHYSEALEIDPKLAEAHNGLGTLLARQGRLEEAFVHFDEALRIKPHSEVIHHNYERALQFLKRPPYELNRELDRRQN